MNSYLSIIFILIGIIVLRFLLYISKYAYLKKSIRKLDIYVQGKLKDAAEVKIKEANKAGKWIHGNNIEIKKAVIKSGVDDIVHSYMQPDGYGNVQQMNMSVLENMLLTDGKFYLESRDLIERANGFYKVEAIKSFNPLFWVEFLIFLPKEILKYFSSNTSSKSISVTKIIQIIYWLLSLLFAYMNLKK
jgi:hypothetical protein